MGIEKGELNGLGSPDRPLIGRSLGVLNLGRRRTAARHGVKPLGHLGGGPSTNGEIGRPASHGTKGGGRSITIRRDRVFSPQRARFLCRKNGPEKERGVRESWSL